ncbi:DUF72 domain-containing protein [Streptomyces sp. SBT349]|uniref:DUF72 domain-containing protein n=1 Tax=Streptomyces sp. SBT349 TaxID=1580539 RepID=UPI00099D723C
MKRLRDPGEPVQRLVVRAGGIGGQLGPVLLQLPSQFRADIQALNACLSCFPDSVRVAIEFRHSSWRAAEPVLQAVLERHGSALRWADRGSRPVTPLWRTASWGYVRFHGGTAKPPPSYGRQALTSWARRIADAWPDEDDVYVYFNTGAWCGGDRAYGRAIRGRRWRRSGSSSGAPVVPGRRVGARCRAVWIADHPIRQATAGMPSRAGLRGPCPPCELRAAVLPGATITCGWIPNVVTAAALLPRIQ